MMSKKEIIELEISIMKIELHLSMAKAQLGYLRDKYPKQHAEAFLYAMNGNEDKINRLRELLEKL